MLRLVVVDIDNTLVRTYIDWTKLRREIASLTGVYIEHRPLIEGVYLYLNPDQLKVALRIIEEAELSSSNSVKPSEPLIEILRNLKKCGCLIAVVTLRERKSAELILWNLGIAELVDILITRDDSMSRPQQVVLALSKLGVSKRDTVFIGDSPEDLEVLVKQEISTIILGEVRNYGVPEETLYSLARVCLTCCGH